MERYRLTWPSLMLLAVLVPSGCQQQSEQPDVSNHEIVTRRAQTTKKNGTAEAGSRITFEEAVYDFGEVSSNRKYTGQFKFSNTGDGLLKISDVKKCCGAVVTLDKKELSPGESGTLQVQYSTGPSAGMMHRQLRVFSNDETNPKVTLDIKAQVVVRVDYQPKKIDLLLNKDNAGCPNITITSLDNQSFSIKSFQSTGDTITADIDPSAQATSFELEPKVDPDKLQERSSGLISIGLTHPELERVSIRFAMKKRFQLIPSGVFLLNPWPQEPNINKVSIVSNYGEDFEIESTSSEKGTAKVVNQHRIANGYRLEVEIMPPPRDETRMFTDIVHVRLKGGEELAIKCYVRYVTK